MKKLFDKIKKFTKLETHMSSGAELKNEFYYLSEEKMHQKQIELLKLEALRMGPKF